MQKINIKFLLASLKTLTYSKETASNYCYGFPSLSLVDFLQCTFMAGFRNNLFRDQRHLSK
jgi:hypothetical protein